MDLQTTKQINIDVAKYKYIKIDAKQYDRNLRYILITCYRNNELLPINNNSHFASIRYRKPDGNGVFNGCKITSDGRILVELTEQMLAVAGFCYADVVIHENVKLSVKIVENADGTVELKDTGNSGIISTMTFAVDVHEAAFDNEEVESSYEYNKLNDLMAKAENTYENVLTTSRGYMNTTEGYMEATEGYMNTTDGYMDAAKGYMDNSKTYMDKAISYAVGGTATRNGEDEDNAKHYYIQSSINAALALDSQKAAATSASTASDKATAASNSASAAANSASAAKTSEDNAATSASTALAAQTEAEKSAAAAKASETAVKENAKTVKNIADGLVGGFIPNGTIAFEDLTSVEKITGYTYNISNDFVTDDTFREGAGMSYTAGTNVYWTNSDEWDCLGGAISPTATVYEVREYLGILDGEIIV